MTPSAVEILEFERAAPLRRDLKAQAIRARFGITPTLYHVALNRALDDPGSLQLSPAVVRRLRRLRDRRRRGRFASPLPYRKEVPVSEQVRPGPGQRSLGFGGAAPPVRAPGSPPEYPSPAVDLTGLRQFVGEVQKAQGMALADGAVSPEWRDRAWMVASLMAAAGEPFTADELRARVGDPPGHLNAIGSLFNQLARKGLIRRIDWRKSNTPTRHRGVIAVWQGTERALVAEPA